MRGMAILLFLLFSVFCNAANANDTLTSAGCLIKANNHILMVVDSVNEKLALPAGMIETGETPAQTAARETLEESGVQARIIQHIANWGAFALYHCQAIEPIKANANPHTPIIRLFGYGALHIGTEINAAMLVNLDKIQPKDLRFPAQLEQLKQATRAASLDSEVHFLQNNNANASVYHQTELKLIQAFQNMMGQTTKPLFLAFNAFGETWLYYCLLPIIFIFLGWQMGARLVLLLLIGQLINHLLKITFGLPRPFDFMPSLQGMPIAGYGLPSGHTQAAALFWGFLYWYDWRNRFPCHKILTLAIASILIIGTGLARIYFGVHFISDITTGALLGILILTVSHQCDRRGWSQSLLDAKWLPWLGLTTIAALCALMTLSTSMLQVFTGLLGLFVGLKQGAAAAYQIPWRKSHILKALFATLTIFGIFLIVFLYALARAPVIDNHHIAALLALKSFTIVYWLSAGNYALLQRLMPKSLGNLPKLTST